MSEKVEKAKYWGAVAYPENMLPDWKERFSDLIEVAAAYCVHTLDRDSKSEHRKDHVHIFIAWKNTTTKKTILNVVNRLSKPGKTCCSTVQEIYNTRKMYDYLIHDTEDARKKGKELYNPSERIEVNGFDIGLYEQISLEDKNEALKELCDLIVKSHIYSFSDLYIIITTAHEYKDDARYWEAFRAYPGVLEKLTKAIYLKYYAVDKVEER